MNQQLLLIDGQWRDSIEGRHFDRLNPLCGTPATRAVAASVSDARQAAEAASRALPTWSALGPSARRKFLLKAAHEIEARTDKFIQAMAHETGVSAQWAGFNIHLAADMLIEAAALTTQIGGEHEESFGPVKPVVRVDGVEAAVACANDNTFGLSAAVFGRDLARAMRVADLIESGICPINGPTVHDEAQMPFGGMIWSQNPMSRLF